MSASDPSIWLLQDGEPLPTDSGVRLMRTGMLAESLAKRGWNVSWFASRFSHTFKSDRDGLISPLQIRDKLRIFLLNGGSYDRNVSLRRIVHQHMVAWNFGSLANSLAAPDLVLSSYPTPELAYAGKRFASARRIPFVVDVRDPWPEIISDYLPAVAFPFALPFLSYYRSLSKRTFAKSDAIIASSHTMLNWARSLAPNSVSASDRVFYHAYPPPLGCGGVALPETFSEANPLRCVFVGTFGHSYDIPMVLAAAKLLAERGEHRVRICIIGDGENRQRWEAQNPGLPMVEFTGWLSKAALEERLRQSHIGLLVMTKGISRFTIPNKVGEYLAHSLGIINSMPNEAAGLVSDSNIGVSIAPGDAPALAAVLKELANSVSLVESYTKGAAQTFQRLFSAEIVYSQYAEFLETLLSCRALSSGLDCGYIFRSSKMPQA